MCKAIVGCMGDGLPRVDDLVSAVHKRGTYEEDVEPDEVKAAKSVLGA